MEHIKLPIKPTSRKGLIHGLFRDKLKSPVILMLLLLGVAACSFITAQYGFSMGLLSLVVLVAGPATFAIVVYPLFGMLVLLIMAYFVMWFLRMGVNFPLGTVMDGVQALLILGFLLRQKKDPRWSIFRDPVSWMILVWIGYNMIEVFNPWAASQLAWLYTVRSTALVMIMYFIFNYYIRDIRYIRLLFKVWIGLSLFAAIYAFKQEQFGFFTFEERQFNDPVVQSLLFIGGVWRKFSIFSDPVAFAYNMVVSAILCICLAWGPAKKWKKVTLILLAGFFMFMMLSSGTRGAYVLVPAAMILFLVMNFNKKVLVFVSIVAALVAALILVPTSNPTIVRFQSAFKPSQDASFNVRKANQKRIQPYILTHPLGGGLGATGVWGQRFAPNTYLANFPPDSGYVRVAVETGWLGLLLFCALMFTILWTGINNFYRIRNPELKAYCLAMVLMVFALNIGNYPQEALVQFPINIYFYLMVALIHITYRLDREEQKQIVHV